MSLKTGQQTVYRVQDALRKQIARMSKSEPQIHEPSTSISHHNQQFHLKDRTGVIKPEVRDMLRNLACEGISTRRALNIINIIATGLGVEISGTISTRTVSRVTLEGLIQARMQVAHELNTASCK